MSTVLKAGSQTGAGTITIGYHTELLKIRATSAAVVKLNNQSINLAVNTLYEDIYGDYDTIVVVSGNIEYMAIG